MKNCIYIALIFFVAAGILAENPPDVTKITVNDWVSLFDGKTLNGWKPLRKTKYEEGGPVVATNSVISISQGYPYSAVNWTNDFLRTNYKVELRAKRTQGGDIFCGILFPVGTNYCTMVLGGWANNVVGLSCVDHYVAAENQTAVGMSFENDKWYDVRLQVTSMRIQTWVDGKELINLELEDHKISPYPGLEMFAPLGIFTFESGAEIKDIYVGRVRDSDIK